MPLVVPSLFHSWSLVPLLAAKKSVPPTLTRSVGFELAADGLMSATSVVPLNVPSLFHNSRPCVPSLAVKNSVPLTFVRYSGANCRAWIDVLDQRRPTSGAVGLPQLLAGGSVVGHEKQRAPDGNEIAGVRAGPSPIVESIVGVSVNDRRSSSASSVGAVGFRLGRAR